MISRTFSNVYLQTYLHLCKNNSMRQPSEGHNVARLRAFLIKNHKSPTQSKLVGHEFDQEHFAAMIGCSVARLRNIETGRTALDELTARRISDETGIKTEWLLENDTKAPPVAAFFAVRPDKRGRYAVPSVIREVSKMSARGAPFTAETYKH